VILLDPAPAGTIQVPIGVPGPDQVAGFAQSNSYVIALLIVTIVVAMLLRWLWNSMAVRIVGAAVIGGWLVYLVTKG